MSERDNIRNCDGNLESLRRYENKIDEAEADRERFEKEVEESIFEELEALRVTYDRIKSSYCYDDLRDEFRNYVNEVM